MGDDDVRIGVQPAMGGCVPGAGTRPCMRSPQSVVRTGWAGSPKRMHAASSPGTAANPTTANRESAPRRSMAFSFAAVHLGARKKQFLLLASSSCASPHPPGTELPYRIPTIMPSGLQALLCAQSESTTTHPGRGVAETLPAMWLAVKGGSTSIHHHLAVLLHLVQGTWGGEGRGRARACWMIDGWI